MIVVVKDSKYALKNDPYIVKDCAFFSTGTCKKCINKCENYLPITPSCENCEHEISCSKANLIKYCRKWNPTTKSEYINLIKNLTNINDTNSLPLNSFDDSDFKLSPNFITHCLDRIGMEPYPKQIQEASNFFIDICPKCTNPKYRNLYDEKLGNILDNVVFLEWGKCPRCKQTRNDIINKYPEYYWFDELCGVAGQRSGKSELVAMIASYVWEWYTKISSSSIAKYFGLSSATRLHMTFVALTYTQAKDTLWNPFSEYLRNGWWYKEYHKFLEDRSKQLGIDSVLKFDETSILYRHKNLQCAPLGPDKRTLRGRTRIFQAIDELGWFTGSKDAIKINPDEVYKALSNSLKTIRGASKRLRERKNFYHIPTGYSCNISSPHSARDGIMRLLYSSRKIKSIYAFHYPTWEMNPTFTREDFEEEFEKNELTARRDFGAFPPLTECPFISDITTLLKNVRQSKKNIFHYKLYTISNKKTNKQYVSAILNNIDHPGKPILLAIDCGHSNNSFAIVALSYNNNGQAIVEGSIEIKPMKGKPVNFNHVYKTVIKKIINRLNVIAVFFDRWQSLDLQSRIEDDFDGKVEAIQYSLKYSDFEFVRKKILGEQVLLPKPEIKKWDRILRGLEEYEDFFINRPISHLLLQMVTVQDSGRRVEKSGDLDDDIFRAMSLGIKFVFDDDYKIFLIQYVQDSVSKSLGIARGLSGGSSFTGLNLTKNTSVLAKNSMGTCKGLSK